MSCAGAPSPDQAAKNKGPRLAPGTFSFVRPRSLGLPLRTRRRRGMCRLFPGQAAEVLLDQRAEAGRHLIRAGGEHAVRAVTLDLAAEPELDLTDALTQLLLQASDLWQVLERVAEPESAQRV